MKEQQAVVASQYTAECDNTNTHHSGTTPALILPRLCRPSALSILQVSLALIRYTNQAGPSERLRSFLARSPKLFQTHRQCVVLSSSIYVWWYTSMKPSALPVTSIWPSGENCLALCL